MAKNSYNGSLLIESNADPESFLKWKEFTEKVNVKGNFSDAEVQRALDAGYTLDDVNNYLQWSGITPVGSFGVGGYNDSPIQSGSGDGARTTPGKVPYYKYFGNATAAPKAPAPAPETKTEAPAPTTPSLGNTSLTAPGNPALSIPGTSIRLIGENIGIKAKNSSARIAGLINKGTNRLKIPRSSSGGGGRSPRPRVPRSAGSLSLNLG